MSAENSSLVMQFEAKVKVGDGPAKSLVLLRLFPSLHQMRDGLSKSASNKGKFIVDWSPQLRIRFGRDLNTPPCQGG